MKGLFSEKLVLFPDVLSKVGRTVVDLAFEEAPEVGGVFEMQAIAGFGSGHVGIGEK